MYKSSRVSRFASSITFVIVLLLVEFVVFVVVVVVVLMGIDGRSCSKKNRSYFVSTNTEVL
jgi:hypothetical protein